LCWDRASSLWKTQIKVFKRSQDFTLESEVQVKKILLADKGDVPGWVLITLMTAGLVVLIWAFAGPALQGVFEQAMDRVVSF
jgi:hypothetical protein